MKIGIIGAGKIGSTAARLFVSAGHEVALSNSRGPDSLSGLVAELGPHARAMSPADAAAFGEVVLLAVPWRDPAALPPAESVRGKVVIDAMNPYANDGSIVDLGTTTSSEETLKLLPGARLVKAFNTIYYRHLANNGRPGDDEEDRDAIFIAGDDAEAKATVAELIESIGFAAVDTGSLHDGGKQQQPGQPLYNKPMTAMSARALLGGEPPG
jgi:predicted dinucleotide-binding enzyme